MRKITLAILAARLVMSAGAARIDWAVTDVTSGDIYSNLYLLTEVQDYYQNESAIAISNDDLGMKGAGTTLLWEGTGLTTTTYGDGVSALKDYYVVLVPRAEYVWFSVKVGDLSEFIYDTSLGETSPGVYELSMTLFDGAEKRQFGAIPEPTAGLLALLGLAALALRRKSARRITLAL